MLSVDLLKHLYSIVLALWLGWHLRVSSRELNLSVVVFQLFVRAAEIVAVVSAHFDYG